MKILATEKQKQLIHRLKRQFHLDDDTYRGLISQYSNGRTTSSVGMYKTEATALIRSLIDPEGRQEAEREEKICFIKAIYAVSLEIGILNKDFPTNSPEGIEMNKAKINRFLLSHGKVKKPISQQNAEELALTLRQMKALAKKED